MSLHSENIHFKSIGELLSYLSDMPESIWDLYHGQEILKYDKDRLALNKTGKFVDYTKYYPRGATYSKNKGSRTDLNRYQRNRYKYLNRLDESPYYYNDYSVVRL